MQREHAPPIPDGSPTVSVIISTRNRPRDLGSLLATLLEQITPPLQVIVVDDSEGFGSFDVVQDVESEFSPLGCELIYLRGSRGGSAAARNLGASSAKGDVVLFLDDDILLDDNVISEMTGFLQENPLALGVQPSLPAFALFWRNSSFGLRLENQVGRLTMATYHEKDKLSVRMSGAEIFPARITKVIPVQRLMGCSFCLRRHLLREFHFDVRMRNWGPYSDLDLTYRIFKRYPGSLFAIPSANVVHTHSAVARPPSRIVNRLSTVHWFYVFFKDVSSDSLLNACAFMWALWGSFFGMVLTALVARDGSRLITAGCMVRDYTTSLLRLRSIRKGQLDFIYTSS